MNLSDLYAAVKQRALRDRMTSWSELAAHARALARISRDQPTVAAAKSFAKAERAWLTMRDRPLEPLAPRFIEAIRSKNHFTRHSTVNTHASGWNPEIGWIYIATSKKRRGQVKIGATTYEPSFRARKLRERFSDPSIEIRYSVYIRLPAAVEARIAIILAPYRMTSNALGESIEWYRVSVARAREVIDLAI